MPLKQAKFIEIPRPFDRTYKQEDPTPLFRKTFFVKEGLQSATLSVCGLGYGLYFLNGERVTGDLFIAPVSNYDKTLWYTSYEVGNRLHEGENLLAAMLGNGFYNEAHQSTWENHLAPWRDNLKLLLCLALTYADGTEYVYSDESWKCDFTSSPIRFHHLRCGEVHDLRLPHDWMNTDYNDADWVHAIYSKKVPGGVLRECKCQPIRERREYAPVSCFQNADGHWLLDFGQNMSGYLRVRLCQPAGDRITIRYAERLFADGRRDDNGVEYSRYYPESPFQTDAFICNGEERVWQPCFVYHGFRYAIIDGLREKPVMENYRAIFVCQAVDEIGHFSCSDEMINRLNHMGRMSTLSNLFYMVTDCPTREKFGWCNDARASTEQMLQNFDIVPLYRKWIQDMYDAMREDGALPGIVPTPGWGYEWGHGPLCDSVLFELPYKIYRYFDDDSLLRASLPYFKRYLAFASSHADENGLIGFGLSDWAGPFSEENDGSPLLFTDSMLVMEFYRIAARAAAICGDTEGEQAFSCRARELETAIRHAYYDAQSGRCLVEEQTAVAMMIVNRVYDRLAPLAAQLKALVEQRDFHHHCGMLGMQYLFFALNECGLEEYAYRIVTAKGRPSYGEWIDNDATTMWEMWHTGESKNHHMYSGVLGWFNRTIAGLNLHPEKNAYRDAQIKPVFLSALDHCTADYETAAGHFAIHWQRQGAGLIALEVTVPAGATAGLCLNGYTLEDGSGYCQLSAGENHFLCKRA